MPTLTPKLKKEYEDLFAACVIRTEKAAAVKKVADRVIANRARYEEVEKTAGVPWYVIGAIHSLESSLNFKAHLHNGDPLDDRTVQMPKGRPKTGEPPFTWETSAADALEFDNLTSVKNWTLATTLFKLEGFNGFSYRNKHPEVLTPYLWSFSNHYAKGKFVADGKFDASAVSKQCGAAVLFKQMIADKLITIPS